MLDYKKPGNGISAKYYLEVIGTSVNKNLKKIINLNGVI